MRGLKVVRRLTNGDKGEIVGGDVTNNNVISGRVSNNDQRESMAILSMAGITYMHTMCRTSHMMGCAELPCTDYERRGRVVHFVANNECYRTLMMDNGGAIVLQNSPLVQNDTTARERFTPSNLLTCITK